MPDYRPRARRTSVSKAYVLQLEQRIRALEERIAGLEPKKQELQEGTKSYYFEKLDELGAKYNKRLSRDELEKLYNELKEV